MVEFTFGYELSRFQWRSNHSVKWQYNELKNGNDNGIYRLGNVFAFTIYSIRNSFQVVKIKTWHTFEDSCFNKARNNFFLLYCNSAWNDSDVLDCVVVIVISVHLWTNVCNHLAMIHYCVIFVQQCKQYASHKKFNWPVNSKRTCKSMIILFS